MHPQVLFSCRFLKTKISMRHDLFRSPCFSPLLCCFDLGTSPLKYPDQNRIARKINIKIPHSFNLGTARENATVSSAPARSFLLIAAIMIYHWFCLPSHKKQNPEKDSIFEFYKRLSATSRKKQPPPKGRLFSVSLQTVRPLISWRTEERGGLL